MRLVGDVPFHLKFALKVTHPFKKRRLRPMSAYNVSTVRASEKCSILIGSRARAFQRAIDEVRTLLLTTLKGGSKSEFVVFVDKIQVQSNKVCYKVFCVKTISGKAVVEPFPCPMVYRCWQ